METKNPNESFLETIQRTLEEEANGIEECKIETKVGEYNILDLALVRCFLVRVTKHKNLLTGKEVNNHQWLPPTKALNLKLRPGAKEMIADFLHSKDKF